MRMEGKITIKVLFSLFIWNTLYPALALDIPLESLTVVGEFHCFHEFRRCFSPLEYCNSDFKECRPCSKYICSRKEEEIPLMCRLNCTISMFCYSILLFVNSILFHFI